MNPAPGSAAGRHANPRSFQCSFVDCGQVYDSPDILRFHVDQTHLYPPPKFQHPGRGQQIRYVGPHPLRNASIVASTNAPVSPTNGMSQQPIYNYPEGPVGNISQRPLPSQGPIPPPLVQNQVPSPSPTTQSLTDQQALSEAIKSWSSIAHALLKDLIITYGVFAAPQTPQEHDKLVELYEKFHAVTRNFGINLATNDDILWQLFTIKVGTIHDEMLAQAELVSTPQGLVCRKLPQKSLFLTTPRQEPLSTPPTTPILPGEQLNDGMDMWNSMDGNAQARILRKMLRAAKNPKRIVFECEEYCTEIRSKEEREARNDTEQPSDSGPTKETNARSTQRPTPSKTPDPTSKSLDLKTLMEKSLREVRLKRAREKKALETSEDEKEEENIEPKRMRLNHWVE